MGKRNFPTGEDGCRRDVRGGGWGCIMHNDEIGLIREPIVLSNWENLNEMRCDDRWGAAVLQASAQFRSDRLRWLIYRAPIRPS